MARRAQAGRGGRGGEGQARHVSRQRGKPQPPCLRTSAPQQTNRKHADARFRMRTVGGQSRPPGVPQLGVLKVRRRLRVTSHGRGCGARFRTRHGGSGSIPEGRESPSQRQDPTRHRARLTRFPPKNSLPACYGLISICRLHRLSLRGPPSEFPDPSPSSGTPQSCTHRKVVVRRDWGAWSGLGRQEAAATSGGNV